MNKTLKTIIEVVLGLGLVGTAAAVIRNKTKATDNVVELVQGENEVSENEE